MSHPNMKFCSFQAVCFDKDNEIHFQALWRVEEKAMLLTNSVFDCISTCSDTFGQHLVVTLNQLSAGRRVECNEYNDPLLNW